jgi:hypothetical protein
MKSMLSILALQCLTPLLCTAGELVTWAMPLDDQLPAILKPAKGEKSSSMEFVVRFFSREKELWVQLYGFVRFRLTDEAGNEVEGEYGRDSGPLPERADLLCVEPGNVVSSLWRVVVYEGAVYLPDRTGGSRGYKNLKPGKYRVHVGYYRGDEPPENSFVTKIEDNWIGTHRVLYRGTHELGSFEFEWKP